MSFRKKIKQAFISVKTKVKVLGKKLEAKLKADDGLHHKYLQEHDQQALARHEAEMKLQAEAQAEQAQAQAKLSVRKLTDKYLSDLATDYGQGFVGRYADKDLSDLATDYAQEFVGRYADKDLSVRATYYAQGFVGGYTDKDLSVLATDYAQAMVGRYADKDLSTLGTDPVQELVAVNEVQGTQAQTDTQAKAPEDALTQANAINAALQARIAVLEKAAEVKATQAALKAASDTTTALQAKLQLLLAQEEGQDFSAEQMVIPTGDTLRTASNDSHLDSLDASIIAVPSVDTLHM